MTPRLVFIKTVGLCCTVFCTAISLHAQTPGTEAKKAEGRPLPEPNAYEYFLRAGEALVDAESLRGDLPPVDKEILIKRNATALEILRQGFAYEYRQPDSVTAGGNFPHLGRIRMLARLLVAEGDVRCHHEDWGGGVASYLDAIQLGHQVPRGAALIGLIVGHACESLGRGQLWQEVNRLDASVARAGASRLEKMGESRVPFADVLRDEVIFFGSGELRTMMKAARNPRLSEQEVIDRYRQLMETEIAEAMNPYIVSTQKPVVGENVETFEEQVRTALASAPDATTAAKGVFGPTRSVVNRTRFSYTLNCANDALLMTALVLRAFHEEHNSYPVTLTQLVPTCLSKVPLDPFAMNEPLHYKLDGENYLLYSLGPDGKDDGGIQIENPGKTGKQKHLVVAESKGDIVAWINTQ